MNIETTGLGAGNYPEPKEEEKNISATIYVKYTLDTQVPKRWDDEQIKEYIKEEFNYLDFEKEIEEIEL